MANVWNYMGDINLECGGYFWREDGADDYVLAVEVIPASDLGGPDNMFYIESGSIYLPSDPNERKRALDVIGVELGQETRADLIYAFRAYSGLSGAHTELVQIGKKEEPGGRGWDDRREADTVLRANHKLVNYVKKNHLD